MFFRTKRDARIFLNAQGFVQSLKDCHEIVRTKQFDLEKFLRTGKKNSYKSGWAIVYNENGDKNGCK